MMTRNRAPSRSSRSRGFTLIELLVVISIIAVLISILLPALSLAKEQGKKTVCMSNMRQIGSAIGMYLSDGNDNLPWTYIHQTFNNTNYFYPGTNIYSSYSWGGQRAPRPDPGENNADFALVPPELRPLNKFLAKGVIGKADVKVTRCPGDVSSLSPTIGFGPTPIEAEDVKSSWEAFGTSYSMNWFFIEDPMIPDMVTDQVVGGNSFDRHLMWWGRRVLQANVGGYASEFVIMWENQCDQLFVGADEKGHGRRGPGWHKKFSFHSMLFLDGHTEHRYFDTRYSVRPGWRVWNFRKNINLGL